MVWGICPEEKTSIESIKNRGFVEILDYERVEEIVKSSDRFAIGLCSCRHEKGRRTAGQ
ncbi:MAG: hypothetical protein NT072_11110 [Deltaproteobacteria bacterium]|nr:hypothetical protein [Deltaproteobacteria bacterium]